MHRTKYFAYVSNMDVAQMDTCCHEHVRLGHAVLDGWRFHIMERGYATIVPEEGAEVWGLLWDLSSGDVARLDRYEGVRNGLYCKETMTVTDPANRPTQALVYIATESNRGSPKPDYMSRVIAAGRASGFSDSYIAELESWG